MTVRSLTRGNYPVRLPLPSSGSQPVAFPAPAADASPVRAVRSCPLRALTIPRHPAWRGGKRGATWHED